MDSSGLKISAVIPAHNEEGSIEETLDGLVKALGEAGIDYELLVVDDSSTDRTRSAVQQLGAENPRIRYYRSHYPRGFGFPVRAGLDEFSGDAVAIVMADASDDPGDSSDTTRSCRSRSAARSAWLSNADAGSLTRR